MSILSCGLFYHKLLQLIKGKGREVVEGKSLIVVDDSVIRGTTMKRNVKKLKAAGAKEIILLIACPPHTSPCYYGKDFPTSSELLANRMSNGEILEYLDCDYLGYLSLEGMLDCATKAKEDFCTACWTGEYPTPLVD